MDAINRILVVDDDFATLEFLRSILALAEESFDVLGVPSAEEALFALRQTPYHLLITDMRLPGISGTELVQKIWAIRPGIPVIMITAYDEPALERAAADLGIGYYFRKPLDAEDVLAAVYNSIRQAEGESPGPVVPGAVQDKVAPTIARRLDSLRADTGARQVVLASVTGELLYQSGERLASDLPRLVAAMAAGMNTSFRLAAELGEENPVAIQFLTGSTSDVYFSNVDDSYFVAIFFDAQVQRGRIGTIWVFGRRAINDLRTLLVEAQQAGESDEALPNLDYLDQLASQPDEAPQAELVQATPESGLATTHEPVAVEAGSEQATSPDPFRDAHQPTHAAPIDAQLESLLNQMVDQGQLEGGTHESLEAFWDEALAASSDAVVTQGISWAEARELGLFGHDFSDEEE